MADIFKDSKIMSQLIKDLLNVSRLEMGNLELKIGANNPGKIVNDIVKNVAPQLKRKKLRLKKRFSDGLPQIYVDEGLISLAVENVISNAINYTSKGGLITLEIGKKSSGVVIKISDTGCGIPEKEQARVFDKLYRASNIMAKSEGTGLGLYIAKYAVEKCGGKIWLDSAEGKGTTFYISLPVHKEK